MNNQVLFSLPDYYVRVSTRKRLTESGELLFQCKSDKCFYDGGIEAGEWVTTGRVTNYTEAMGLKKKPSLLDKIKRFLR